MRKIFLTLLLISTMVLFSDGVFEGEVLRKGIKQTVNSIGMEETQYILEVGDPEVHIVINEDTGRVRYEGYIIYVSEELYYSIEVGEYYREEELSIEWEE